VHVQGAEQLQQQVPPLRCGMTTKITGNGKSNGNGNGNGNEVNFKCFEGLSKKTDPLGRTSSRW
jgi:hypothetical protein